MNNCDFNDEKSTYNSFNESPLYEPDEEVEPDNNDNIMDDSKHMLSKVRREDSVLPQTWHTLSIVSSLIISK